MYGRHLRGSNPNLSTMINRPPRPPCWRDFLQPAPESPTKRNGPRRHKGVPQSLSFSDLSSAHHRSKSEGSDLSKVGAHSSKSTSHKKLGNSSRSRLHRTRSQVSINQEHLPEPENMTVTLADTKPRELLRKPTFDARIYLDDNTRRCEKWLAGVRASEPLDDVVSQQGSVGKVEVLEENWIEVENAKNFHNNSSTSESDIDSVSTCCGSNVIDSESNNKRGAHRIHDARKPKKMESQGQSARGNWLRKVKSKSGNAMEMEVVPEQLALTWTPGPETSSSPEEGDLPGPEVDSTARVNEPNPSPAAVPGTCETDSSRDSIMDVINEDDARVKNSIEIFSDSPKDDRRVSLVQSRGSMISPHDDGDYDDLRVRHYMPGYVTSESDFDWKTSHAAVNVGQS